MKILAISGSVRPNSSNSALLKAVRVIIGHAISEWTDFKISELSFFDPENQFGVSVPFNVQELRASAQRSDFILIATPEYAHGIPGVLKNALE